MLWILYHRWLEAQVDGSLANTPVDFDSDTLKVALATVSYGPDATTDANWATVQTDEIGPAPNYTAGGEALVNCTVTLSNGIVTLDNSADLTWLLNGSGFADARYALLYKDTGTPATSPLIAYADFGSDKGTVAGDLTLQFNGIITWS